MRLSWMHLVARVVRHARTRQRVSQVPHAQRESLCNC